MTEKRNPSLNGSRVKIRSSCLHNAWKLSHPQYVFNYFIKFGGERRTRGKREGGVPVDKKQVPVDRLNYQNSACNF